MQTIMHDGTNTFQLVPGAVLKVTAVDGGSYALLTLKIKEGADAFLGDATSKNGVATAGPFLKPAIVQVEAKGRVSVHTLFPGAMQQAGYGGIPLGADGLPARLWERALSVAQASLNGTTDDTAALQEAFNSVTVPGKHRFIDFRELCLVGVDTIKLNGNLVLLAPNLSIDFSSVKFDASASTGGNSVAFTGQTVWPYNQRSACNVVRGLQLVGPDTDATSADGVRIGLDTSVPGHMVFENLQINGFRDNLVFGSNYYISQIRNPFIGNAHRYNLNFTGSSNAGESINIYGGSVSDAKNAAGTALGLYVPASAAGPDMIFHGTSFSYNDVGFDIGCGNTNFKSVHFEAAKRNAPYGYVCYSSGRAGTTVTIDGGQITHGGLGSGTESSTGRPHFFVVRPNTGDRLLFAIRSCGYNGFDKKTTELIHYGGTAHPSIVVDGVNCVPSGNTPRICGVTSLIYNGDFSVSVTAGWTSTDGTGVVSQDTTVNTDTAGINAWATGVSVAGNFGFGYTAATVVALSGGGQIGSAPATAVPNISIQGVANCTVSAPGNYSSAPTLTFSGGTLAAVGGAQAKGTAVMSGNSVVGVNMTDPGNYAAGSAAPTIAVATTNGTGAVITANAFVQAPIQSVTLTYDGVYTPGGSAPTVTITDSGGGSGAVGVASLSTKKAMKVIGSGGTTTRSQIIRNLRPGQKLSPRCFNRIDSRSGGSIKFWVEWLDSLDATISSSTIGSDLSAVAAYTIRGSQLRVPRGCVAARINVSFDTFTGTGYVGDIEAHVV